MRSDDLVQHGIRVVPLGAGQDVGRSCIIVTIGGKNIMLDCGMHMGFKVRCLQLAKRVVLTFRTHDAFPTSITSRRNEDRKRLIRIWIA